MPNASSTRLHQGLLALGMSLAIACEGLWAGDGVMYASLPPLNLVDASVTLPMPSDAPVEVEWRHTSRGWEPLAAFQSQPSPSYDPWFHTEHIHPVLVAVLLTLVSVGALASFDERPSAVLSNKLHTCT